LQAGNLLSFTMRQCPENRVEMPRFPVSGDCVVSVLLSPEALLCPVTWSKCLIYCKRWAFMMSEQRLGDVIDDHCIKCRRITNHSIVSLVEGQAAKVRCRTCYHDHDYRHEIAPPTKKELKKAEAEAQALLAAQSADGAGEVESPTELKSKGGHA
jgi:hypothetical protein